ncbi:MAG: aminoacyl-tRNA deacylase [FCB group bacterium]|jgi:Cys-tRNA(Pro) deacylase
MTKIDFPVTPVVRFLREKGINFEPYLFDYEEKGGSTHTAKALNIPEHIVIKTLVFEIDYRQIFLMLMHGDCEVSTKELARIIGAKSVIKCDEKKATNATGYIFGGTSPFGTKKMLPVYIEKTIFDESKIYINSGKRGFLIAINPKEMNKCFKFIEVQVAIHK